MAPRDQAYIVALLVLCATTGQAAPAATHVGEAEVERLAQLPPIVVHRVDHSGRKQKGQASYYARHFTHRKMADGHAFNPASNAAACKTLPLGTTAKVTNLTNGRSAVVKIEDRGPRLAGRVVDVAPKVADQLDMQKAGVTPVVVAPIAVPQPDGRVKLGAGAAEASPQEVQNAMQEAATR